MKAVCPVWLHTAVVVLLIAWLAARIAPEALRQTPFGVWRDTAGSSVRDFPSHLRMVRSIWTGEWRQAGATSPYTPAAHRKMAEDWLGESDQVLPFAYSPTMLYVMGPFALLSDRAAYLAWTTLSLAVVAWMIRPTADPLLLGCGVFISPLAVWALHHGQTVFLSAAGLFYLFHPGRAAPRPALAALALWALTAKPPLAVTAGVVLLACGAGQIVLMALVLTILSTLALQSLLGPAWAGDYLDLLSTYNAEQADVTFAWCLKPVYMSNLRAVLYALGWSDALASRVSSAAWVASLAVLAGCGWRKLLPGPAVAALAVVSLLLFAPHANFTEELHLFVAGVCVAALGRRICSKHPHPPAASPPEGERVEVRGVAIRAWAFPGVVWLSCLLGAGPGLYPGPAFLGKLVLVVLTIRAGLLAQRP